MKDKICDNCKIGILIQLVSDEQDVAYCPVCESIFKDCVVWSEK